MLHAVEVFQEQQRFAETFSVHVHPTHPVHHRFTLTISLQWKAGSLVTIIEKLSAHPEDEVAAPVLLAEVEDFQVTRKNQFQLHDKVRLHIISYSPRGHYSYRPNFRGRSLRGIRGSRGYSR